jgi:hypothetical protein
VGSIPTASTATAPSVPIAWVKLNKGPPAWGIRASKFTSATGATGINFERKFVTPGTYDFFWTHSTRTACR